MPDRLKAVTFDVDAARLLGLQIACRQIRPGKNSPPRMAPALFRGALA